MTFENNISPPPSTWSMVRDQLPMILFGSGITGLFFGLHLAATAVVLGAIFLLVLGLVSLGVRRIRQQRRAPDAVDAR